MPLLACAEYYREKLRAEVDGRPYTPPAPSADNKMMPRNKSFAASPHADWDDWGAGGAPAGDAHGAAQQRSGSEYSLSQLQASAADKDNFFARKQAENASRPEGVPPSQGARPAGRPERPLPTAAGAGRRGCLHCA